MSGAPSPTGARRATTAATLVPGALLAATGTVAAQRPPLGPVDDGFPLLLDALGGALVSLVVCGLLLLVARSYVERTTDRVFEQPVGAFLYGLGLVVAGLVVAVLLTLTVVGVVLVVPMVVSALVFGQLGYLAAARLVVDDPRLVLVVAVGIGAATAGVPVVGGLVGFGLVCVGLGAWYLDYRNDGRTGTDDGVVGFDPGPVGEEHDADATGGQGGPSGGGSGRAGAAGSDPGDPGPADEWTAGFEAESDRE